MTKAERMTKGKAAVWLDTYRAQYTADTLHDCEHGHIGDSTEPGGPCLDEVLGNWPDLA